ncbi:PhoU domain-containing protein [Sulfurovum sp.]|uniref:phosphate signaling complex PhoU family protein n=1 Tax=Sulfurovum sp. TaxID=1969726 RepID=UPI0025EC146A|nr:PhoU domain-containing protein [Sulfurovum sp.]
MLTKYQEARHEVRSTVLAVVKRLAKANEEALKALEGSDENQLEEVRKTIKNITKETEKIDNDIVLIFARYTPEAKDLREMVSYLKITSEFNRIRSNINNYLKNMQSMLSEEDVNIIQFIKESLSINRCTINAFDKTIEMFETFDDNDKIKQLAIEIDVEYAKTDDIYALLEKGVVQKMGEAGGQAEEYFNLLKYIRKNLKIIDRLDSIAQRTIFARIGGKL